MTITKLPWVTIGIPFYNAERYLLDAIKSVFVQSHIDWELILMDDGSTDGSLEIAKSIDDPRVHVISDGENKGLATRLNLIHSLANFDFIARMDADDLMHPDRLSIQLNFLVEHPEYDLVSCGLYSVNDSLELAGVRCKAISRYTFDGLMNKTQAFNHAGLVARRSWFARNKYNENMKSGEDTELWRRTALIDDFKAASIQDLLYIYRECGNVTRKKLLTAYKMERRYTIRLIDGSFRRSQKLAISWIKSVTVVVLDLFGRIDLLLGLRNSRVSIEKYQARYTEIVLKVLNADLPIRRVFRNRANMQHDLGIYG